MSPSRKSLFALASLSFTLALLAVPVVAKDAERVVLKVGDRAPDFVGTSDGNEKWDSKARAGKKIYVVYFYPADMTGGCTKQACAYRDAVKDLQRKDVEVIGISGDSVENHQHFKHEYDLNFTLLADSDGSIAKDFGVETAKGGSLERTIAGKQVVFERGVSAKRWTFVIDKNWKIVHKDTKVDAAKDSENVLKAIEKLPNREAAAPS